MNPEASSPPRVRASGEVAGDPPTARSQHPHRPRLCIGTPGGMGSSGHRAQACDHVTCERMARRYARHGGPAPLVTVCARSPVSRYARMGGLTADMQAAGCVSTVPRPRDPVRVHPWADGRTVGGWAATLAHAHTRSHRYPIATLPVPYRLLSPIVPHPTLMTHTAAPTARSSGHHERTNEPHGTGPIEPQGSTRDPRTT